MVNKKDKIQKRKTAQLIYDFGYWKGLFKGFLYGISLGYFLKILEIVLR